MYLHTHTHTYTHTHTHTGTEDDDADHELRKGAVSSYIALLDKPHLPDILVKIICWVRKSCDVCAQSCDQIT